MLTDERTHTERLLKTYERNLSVLEQQAAQYGGEPYAPVNVINQIEDTRTRVADLQKRLQALGGTVAAGEQLLSGNTEVNSTSPNAKVHIPPSKTSSNSAAPSQQVMLEFARSQGKFTITWRSPSFGRVETSFNPPFEDDILPLVIRALDIVQYANYPKGGDVNEQKLFAFSAQDQEVLKALDLWQHERVPSNAYQVVGTALYQALGSAGQDVLKTVRNASIASRQTTSYVLRFPVDTVNLAGLPWEALWDSEKNQAVLIRGNAIDSCERYLDIDQTLPPPLPSGQRLHMLALTPRYGISNELREAEQQARKESWGRLQNQSNIIYHEIHPLTMRALNDYLDDAPTPDIVHYFGPGIYQDGKGYLVFDSNKGDKDLVNVERLAAILGDVRLVVIHACQSAMVTAEGGLLTGIAPALSTVTGAVVAMQLTMQIEAATRFSEILYNQLLVKRVSLQEAVARARRTLFTEDTDGASWYVPTLYIRSRQQEPIFFQAVSAS